MNFFGRMKKYKNVLDEMQEQKLLKIEHTTCRIAFVCLAASLYIQMALGKNDFVYVGGELTVLSIMSIYMLTGCIKNGIWDRMLKPNFKTNLILSLATGLLAGGFWAVTSYRNYHVLAGSILTFSIMFISVSVITLLLLTLAASLCQKRKKQLDALADTEENQQ